MKTAVVRTRPPRWGTRQAVKIVLNMKGFLGEASDELKDLLLYMDGHKPESEYAKEVDSAVMDVRADEKWRLELMLLNEMLRENRRIGDYRTKVSQVRRGRKRFSFDELADVYFLDPELLKDILDTLDEHPDWDDETVAEHLDF